MTTFLEISPAYGRDYKSGKAAKEDWLDNKDFVESTTGQYINRSQLMDTDTILKNAFGVAFSRPIDVMVRYKRQTMVQKIETIK